MKLGARSSRFIDRWTQIPCAGIVPKSCGLRGFRRQQCASPSRPSRPSGNEHSIRARPKVHDPVSTVCYSLDHIYHTRSERALRFELCVPKVLVV